MAAPRAVTVDASRFYKYEIAVEYSAQSVRAAAVACTVGGRGYTSTYRPATAASEARLQGVRIKLTRETRPYVVRVRLYNVYVCLCVCTRVVWCMYFFCPIFRAVNIRLLSRAAITRGHLASTWRRLWLTHRKEPCTRSYSCSDNDHGSRAQQQSPNLAPPRRRSREAATAAVVAEELVAAQP